MMLRFSKFNICSINFLVLLFCMHLATPIRASAHANTSADPSCLDILVERQLPIVDYRNNRFIDILLKLRGERLSTKETVLSIANKLAGSSPEFSMMVHEATVRKGRVLDDEDTISILAHFQEWFWNSLNHQPSLSRLQDNALDRELDVRGAPRFSGVRGMERLAIVSRMNRDRIWKQNKLSAEYLDIPWIASLVNRLRFEVMRNSHSGEIDGDGILSSRQLMRCCARQGYNTGFAFNSEFLQNDDNIFFFLNFNFKGTSGSEELKSEYGEHGHSLSGLAEEGWISPFIMWPHEFHKIMEVMPLKSAGQSYESKPNSSLGPISHYDATPEELVGRSLLHQYDFTVGDFDMLVKAQFAKMLFRNGEPSYRYWLAKPDLQEIILSELGLDFGPGNGMEFKVPVYLPKGKVSRKW